MTNIKKIHNPFFASELRDYLGINGFHLAESLNSYRTEYFFKGKIAIEVKDNTIIVSVYQLNEVGACTSEYAQQASFTGLSTLDIFKFMLLMDAMGAIPLKHFAAKAIKENNDDLFQSLGNMFRPLVAIK